jgi:hypothetical protein
MYNKQALFLKGGNKMNKRILTVLLVMGIIFLLAACKQNEKVNVVLPPEKGEDVTFKTSSLIYQNDESTSYSIGGVDSLFTFSNDMLSINNNGDISAHEISYDEVPITVDGFKNQFKGGNELPEISSYNKILQYNLCESTNNLSGYRLYILDGQYWIGTLYKNFIWRIVSVDIDK